jgi:hypothetical protein
MKNFLKVADGLDVLPLKLALQRQPDLFDRRIARRDGNSPHAEATDVWVRWNDARPFEERGDWTGFNEEHDSVWYPEADAIPEIRPIVFDVMARVQGERLGGILITKLPPKGGIKPHTDSSWHAGYYDKYYVPIQNEEGSLFGFPDGVIKAKPGEVWWFRNDVPHWVANGSDEERVALIICIRHTRRPA